MVEIYSFQWSDFTCQAHPRSGLKGVLPSAFFSHRMDEGDTTTAFLKKCLGMMHYAICKVPCSVTD